MGDEDAPDRVEANAGTRDVGQAVLTEIDRVGVLPDDDRGTDPDARAGDGGRPTTGAN